MKKETVLEIEEIFDVPFFSHGSYEETFDGFKIKTSKAEYKILIENMQWCCEDWGYFSTNDNPKEFVGKNLLSVNISGNEAARKIEFEKAKKRNDSGLEYVDFRDAQFVDFVMDDGSVLQFAVYNCHNGYYGHDVLFLKNKKKLLYSSL